MATSYPIRPITEDELTAFLTVGQHAFQGRHVGREAERLGVGVVLPVLHVDPVQIRAQRPYPWAQRVADGILAIPTGIATASVDSEKHVTELRKKAKAGK